MEDESRVPTGSVGLKRILFIELRGGITGMMIALPSIQALARSNPQADLDVLTTPECTPLVEEDPSVTRVHVARTGLGKLDGVSSGQSLGPDVEDLESILREGSYDVVISDVRRGGIGQMVESSGARIVVSDLSGNLFPNQLTEEQFLATLAQKGLVDPHYCSVVGRIALSEEEAKWAQCWRGNNLVSRYPTVILNPNAGTPMKRWAPENFISVGRWLASRHHCNVVVLSGDEPDLAEMIGREIGKEATILAKVGIRQLAAVASLSSLVISGDTGPARVAAASGARAIVLFGPTSDVRCGLRPPHVNIRSPRACSERALADLSDQTCLESGECVLQGQTTCVNDIAPEVVMRAAERLVHP